MIFGFVLYGRYCKGREDEKARSPTAPPPEPHKKTPTNGNETR